MDAGRISRAFCTRERKVGVISPRFVSSEVSVLSTSDLQSEQLGAIPVNLGLSRVTLGLLAKMSPGDADDLNIDPATAPSIPTSGGKDRD